MKTIATAALIACLLTTGALASAQEPAMSDLSGIVLEQEDGTPLDLGSLAGKRVLLVTWASW